MTGELQAAQNVIIQEVARDSNAEDVTQPLIEDQFCGCARIDTTQDRSKGELAISCLAHLLHEIAVHSGVRHEARIPLFEDPQGVGGKE